MAPTLFGPSAPVGLARLELLSDAIATILRGQRHADAPCATLGGLHRTAALEITEALRVIAAARVVPGHRPSDQVRPRPARTACGAAYLNDAASIAMLDRALASAVELG